MEGISATSSSQSLIQSVIAQADTANRINTAVAQKAQEIAQQQGSAAVQLIQAAGSVIDVRA